VDATPAKEMIHKTALGDVRIIAFCQPQFIRTCTFDEQFGIHAQYKSIYTKRDTLEKHASVPGANVVLALTEAQRIIGFGVLNFPDQDERWARLGPNLMMEVKAIEVSRNWRAMRIAEAVLSMVLIHPAIEEMIIYMVGYSWTWDLDGTRKTAQQYRQVLIRLFEPFGFQELQTNEPNICLKPENLFMGRIGRNVSDSILHNFKWLRFGIEP
jgi:acetoin utilization protein AcuA